jgi:hypothetical protein
MMHCQRLLEMAMEIGRGEGIIVRRPNADELLSIRRGEIDLQTLIDKAEMRIKELDEIFENSNLPDQVDPIFTDALLITIRRKKYGL